MVLLKYWFHRNAFVFFFWRAANGFGCFCCRNINSIRQQLLLILTLGSLERLNSVQPEWLTGLFHYSLFVFEQLSLVCNISCVY